MQPKSSSLDLSARRYHANSLERIAVQQVKFDASRKPLGRYGLSIVLFTLFLVSWVGQWYFQWEEFAATALQHNQQPTVAEFIPEFVSATLENWQSEFLQLFSFVVLTAFFVHLGSSESQTDSKELEARLDAAITAEFDALFEQIDDYHKDLLAALEQLSVNSTDASPTEPDSGDPTPNDADYA